MSAYFGLVPRQYQSGETDRNGRIAKRGNPLARTILVECAWESLRYNPWAKGVYERISGKQKTRKKKAGVALARKIAVIAWAMLRDEKDWDPATMIRTTKSFGGAVPMDEETFRSMRPKENSDQRKSRLRREARQANADAIEQPKKNSPKAPKETSKIVRQEVRSKPVRNRTARSKETLRNPRGSNSKPRRVRKPVCAG